MKLDTQEQPPIDRVDQTDSRRLLAAVQAAAQLGYWVWKPDRGELSLSPYLSEMLGLECREMLLGEIDQWLDLVHPEDRDRVAGTLASVVEEMAMPFEITHRLAVGDAAEERHVRLRGWTPCHAGGEQTWVASVQDVSEEVRECELLRNEHYWLDTLINAVPGLVCIKDGQGRWILANDYDLELFDLDGVDYKGKTDAELAEYTEFHREALRGCIRTDEVAWQKGSLSRGVERIPRSDGTTPVFETLKVPVFDEDGRRKGLVVVGLDITEREQSERLKDEFLSMVSHELRTPLTPIRGVLSLLAAHSCCHEEPHLADMIVLAQRSSRRLQRLIERLLTFQALSKGDAEFHRLPCDLDDVVRSTVDKHAYLQEKYDFSLQYQCHDESIWVEADRHYLELALGIILGNAAKVSPPGSPVVVTVDSDVDRGHVRISDQGPGIAAEHLERIFDSFVQIDGGVSRPFEGAGVGLTIAKMVVETLDGEITVQSEVGRGSTFVVSLPRITAKT